MHSSLSHVAIIMDGNGRWATRRKRPRIMGYHAGLNSVRTIIQTCLDENIPVLTLFAFSSENWKRPLAEVQFLMNLFFQALQEEVERLNQHQISLKIIGDRSALSNKLNEKIAEAEGLTANNTKLQLNLALNYGGQWDIVQASQTMAKLVQAGHLKPENINAEYFAKHLAGKNLPAIDLLIRTGGEQRLSNFLLWQLAYAELYFTQTLWPDFGAQDFKSAIAHFYKQNRRFGALDEVNSQNANLAVLNHA